MKKHDHLTSDQVDILLRGDLSAEAIRLAVRVLLAGCAVCMETVRQRVLEPGGPGLESPSAAPDRGGTDDLRPKRPRPPA